MNYDEWLKNVPTTISNDALWKMTVYRQSLFLGDICWHDVTRLSQDRRTLSLADQLYRAVGSISANIAEGYSRASSRDQARFYEYALGSAREARDWYYKGHYVLSQPVIDHRLNMIEEIVRQLITVIPKTRRMKIQEENVSYEVEVSAIGLFADIPLPEDD